MCWFEGVWFKPWGGSRGFFCAKSFSILAPDTKNTYDPSYTCECSPDSYNDGRIFTNPNFPHTLFLLWKRIRNNISR